GGKQTTEGKVPVDGETEAVAVVKSSSGPSELQIGDGAEGLRKLGRWGDEIEVQVAEGEDAGSSQKARSPAGMAELREGQGLYRDAVKGVLGKDNAQQTGPRSMGEHEGSPSRVGFEDTESGELNWQLVKGGKNGNRVLSKSQEGLGLPTRFAMLPMDSDEGAVHEENMQCKLRIKGMLFEIDVITNAGKMLCNEHVEFTDHLFFACEFSQEILKKFLHVIKLSPPRIEGRMWMEKNARVFHIQWANPLKVSDWILGFMNTWYR
ncbi:hypothetical protein Dimus_025833, partial [Dionaea muscipula]